jgi:salicylate hydroxylase
LPFLGLGAAMAIEDAAILVRALTEISDIANALQRFEAVRRPRTTLIYNETVRQGQLTQAIDPENYARAPAPAHNPLLFDYDPLTVDLSDASVSL